MFCPSRMIGDVVWSPTVMTFVFSPLIRSQTFFPNMCSLFVISWSACCVWQSRARSSAKSRSASFFCPHTIPKSCPTVVGQPRQKGLRLSVISNPIGMKFGANVLHVNAYRLTESDFERDLRLSRRWPWCHLSEKCCYLVNAPQPLAGAMQQCLPVRDP